jgi:hypothetical protein
MRDSRLAEPFEAGLPRLRVVERTRHQAVEPVNDALTAERDEAHLLDLAGLEANGRPGRQVEAQAVRLFAVEDQGAVDLEEVEV